MPQAGPWAKEKGETRQPPCALSCQAVPSSGSLHPHVARQVRAQVPQQLLSTGAPDFALRRRCEHAHAEGRPAGGRHPGSHRASELGLTAQQVAANLNTSLNGSFQVTPNFWSDPETGIPYQVWVQTPEWRNNSLAALQNTPLLLASAGTGSAGPEHGQSACQSRDNGTPQRAGCDNPRQHRADVPHLRQRAGS
jgi:hypothetical protein